MQKGNIGVTTENIFPIIKKFLYSEHEIFLRELISNAVDATQKMKTLASTGEFKGELDKLVVRVNFDKEAKTITISDSGIGMTSEEIDKYINQIAFSSAGDFLEKYKDKIDSIIGHFGLGFYSSFMVSEKVEIISKSYQEDAKAVHWTCDGSQEYTIEEVEKEGRGTDIILHIEEDSKEFLEEARIKELLTKYCRFLPIEIAFGKKKDWKDDKQVETDEDDIINNTKPAWTQKPADLKDEDYKGFYKELYPMNFEDPLFNIHLNVDYPFNLTGILYFPKIKTNLDINKSKIQLYCNQVFVTDSVENIVPEFLTLLHGVLDSPDIPLNVSRSYLQSDSNVKKIANHVSKKVTDKLNDIFKTDRASFESKWDDLKLFITYGMLSDEKFYERAAKFSFFKNVDGKFLTYDEYRTLIKENQTDKNDKVVYLYTTDKVGQHSFVEAATAKGYDVLDMDGHLDSHLINHLESKIENSKFVRVDADIADKLIERDDVKASSFTQEQQDEMIPVFQSQLPGEANYSVLFEDLNENVNPTIITQSEFMRRMKDMSQMGGGQYSYMGNLPDSYNLVLNTSHPLIKKLEVTKTEAVGEEINKLRVEIKPVKEEITKLEEAKKDKKEEEIPQADKDKLEDLNKKVSELEGTISSQLKEYGKDNKLVKQLIDLALLSNNMLTGEALTKFVKRSVELIEE